MASPAPSALFNEKPLLVRNPSGSGSARSRKHNPILPFHKQVIKELASPEEDDLLVMAKGLANIVDLLVRQIITHLLKLYDAQRNLVIIVNASQSDEDGLGEDLSNLGVRKPGLRQVGYEMNAKQRKQLYESGGLISVTSRILVVDMLTKNIPTELITGFVVLHAERVIQTSLEAFVVRLYRQSNLNGFLKGFSDEPESFSYGLSPMQGVMKNLCLRRVHLWPRFHEKVQDSLQARKADVVELYQPMSNLMQQIQGAVIECMEATLGELKRSCTNVDLDDLTVENALFRNFDRIVRHQLDPVWHRVGNKTKKLIADLTQLRQLLTYLLSYDAVSFHSYLETIIASNSTDKGTAKQNQSPWLFLDAANTLFQSAKRRAYLTKPRAPQLAQANGAASTQDGDEAEWAAVRAAEEQETPAQTTADRNPGRKSRTTGKWPEGVEPVLEELPKWGLLGQVLEEIESHIAYEPIDSVHPGANTVLVMCQGERTCTQLREYLATMSPFVPGMTEKTEQAGRQMMERLLRTYFFWKNGLRDISQNFKKRTTAMLAEDAAASTLNTANSPARGGSGYQRGGQPPNKRRRVRASSLAASVADRNRQKLRTGEDKEIAIEAEMEEEAGGIADFLKASQQPPPPNDYEDEEDPLAVVDLTDETQQTLLAPSAQQSLTDDFDEVAFQSYFGLIPAEDLVIIRPYSGEEDETTLQDIRPRFIVMYDPDPAFIRRVEVYRSTNPGLGVRVYFMIYQDSVEEQKYLSGLRKEKDAFERLIREKANMLIPINIHPRAPHNLESRARTISTRNAGGAAAAEMSRVIVDMREFRSTLPSLLHAADIEVVPATLQVGDYIITPTMCVERKSIPDLIQSFTSGRLFTQCEAMSAHYAQPILLIEFEENKSFNLGAIVESRALPRPAREKDAQPSKEGIDMTSIHAKLVLLTLSFPRLRIVWSSSTQASVDIIADLKINHPEPDQAKAITIGGEEDSAEMGPNAAGGDSSGLFNTGPEEMLRALPGVNSRNYKLISSRIATIRELCEIEDSKKMQEIIGDEEGGKNLFNFLHKDSR